MPFAPHPHLTTPPDDTVLWRYMDFARFVHLLQSRELWFARADQFEDPLEGTFTDGEWFYEGDSSEHQPTFRDIYSNPVAQLMRHTSYVNCWRMGQSESLAMWDLYGKGSGVIAVTSTIRQLKQQMSQDLRPVHMAQVQYVDWSSPNVLRGTSEMIARKDMSYEHEEEMRLFFWDTASIQAGFHTSPERLPVGLPFLVDPQELISAIWIGPRERYWVQPLVEALVARYGMDTPIKRSNKLMTRRRVQDRP